MEKVITRSIINNVAIMIEIEKRKHTDEQDSIKRIEKYDQIIVGLEEVMGMYEGVGSIAWSVHRTRNLLVVIIGSLKKFTK